MKTYFESNNNNKIDRDANLQVSNRTIMPVIKTDLNGNILYANMAAFPIIDTWAGATHKTLPVQFHKCITDAVKQNITAEFTYTSGHLDVYFDVVSFGEAGFIGFYANKVMHHHLDNRELPVTPVINYTTTKNKNMRNLKIIIAAMWLFIFTSTIQAQDKYFTRTGSIDFFSSTALENIEASNSQVSSMLDSGSGDLVFAVLIKAFHFEKALMQEHFNEKYLESDKFPKASFKGKIKNLDTINLKKDGLYNAIVEGMLTIHGVTNPVKTDGVIEVKGGKVIAKSKLQVALADYKIEVPRVVTDNIAKIIDVTIDMAYEPYNP